MNAENDNRRRRIRRSKKSEVITYDLSKSCKLGWNQIRLGSQAQGWIEQEKKLDFVDNLETYGSDLIWF